MKDEAQRSTTIDRRFHHVKNTPGSGDACVSFIALPKASGKRVIPQHDNQAFLLHVSSHGGQEHEMTTTGSQASCRLIVTELLFSEMAHF